MATVTPGAYTDTGCPPATQIDCIVVDKVYDSCVQTITVTQTIRDCDCSISSCAFDLSTSSCAVGAITPTTTTDYNDITFVIGAEYMITCTSGPTLTEQAYTTQTVMLYNPDGTTPSCTILSGTCSCVNLPNGHISCTVTLCVLFQTTATVQLMIPTYGFCVPPTCPAVGPVLPCPPTSLFPPQANS